MWSRRFVKPILKLWTFVKSVRTLIIRFVSRGFMKNGAVYEETFQLDYIPPVRLLNWLEDADIEAQKFDLSTMEETGGPSVVLFYFESEKIKMNEVKRKRDLVAPTRNDNKKIKLDRIEKSEEVTDVHAGAVQISNVLDDSFNTFFSETGPVDYVPRAIFGDLEKNAIEEVQTQTYRQFFHPEKLPKGMDAANNYALKQLEKKLILCFVDNKDGFDNFKNVGSQTYTSSNRMISQIMSRMARSLRFDGAFDIDLTETQRIMPYPKIYFPLEIEAPVLSAEHFIGQLSVSEVTRTCFEPAKINCHPRQEKSFCLLYRGDVLPTSFDSSIAINAYQRRIHFKNWFPTGFGIGLDYQSPRVVLRAVSMLKQAAIPEAWARLDLTYAKRAFVHSYVMESEVGKLDEFSKAREEEGKD